MSHGSDPGIAGALLALLERQHALYAQLRELSGRQRGLIGGERPERLVEILQARQALVLALARLNEELAPYRRDWDMHYQALSPADRARAGGLLESIQALLQGILKSDQEDCALLAARKQVVANDLNRLVGASAAHSAYSSRNVGSAFTPRSADITG